jgi:hypothetical protein
MATQPVDPMLPIGPTKCGGPGEPACDPIPCVIRSTDGKKYTITGHTRIQVEPTVAPEQFTEYEPSE